MSEAKSETASTQSTEASAEASASSRESNGTKDQTSAADESKEATASSAKKKKGAKSGREKQGPKSIVPRPDAGAAGSKKGGSKTLREPDQPDSVEELDESLLTEAAAPTPPSSAGLRPPRRGSAPPPPPTRSLPVPPRVGSRPPPPSPPGAPSSQSRGPEAKAPEISRGPMSASKLPPPPPLKSRVPAPPPRRPIASVPPAPPSRRPPAPPPSGLSVAAPSPGLSAAAVGMTPAAPGVASRSVPQQPLATPLPGQPTPLSPGVSPVVTPLPQAAAVAGPEGVAEAESLLDAESVPDLEASIKTGQAEESTDDALSQSLPTHAAALPPVVAVQPLSEPDAQPTQFDVPAGERHASPWTLERQRETILEHARQLVDLFESQIARKPPREREGRLHYEMARLYESPLRQLDEAARHFEHASRLMPQHVPSLRGARRVLLALGRHKQVLKLFDAEIEATGDSSQKATLYFQKGRLLAESLGQKADARAAFEQAAQFSPNRLDILKALAGAEEQAGAWHKLIDALGRAANAAVSFPAEQAAYLVQMARVQAVHLKDVKQAIELYKAALGVDPGAPAALHALKELLYEDRRWKELVEALELEASLATTREAQAFAKFRAGLLWVDKLSDLARGVTTLEQASALCPQDLAILEELTRLYEITDQPKNLASAMERLVAQQQRPPVEVLHRLGQLYEGRLNQPELAIERYVAALAIDPAYRPVTLALSQLYQQRGDWRALAETLNREAEVSDDAQHRADLHARIAELCEVRLGSVDYAIEHHKKALELRPAYDVPFKALSRLYSQLHRWVELIELYHRGIEVAKTDAERVSLLFSIGRLEEEALGQPEAAARTYDRIVELNPQSLEAVRALQRACERGGEYRRLVEALQLEVTLTKERPTKLALRHRAACVLADQLGEVEPAVEGLRSIIAEDSSYLPAIVKLAELLHAEERWEDLLQAYAAELAVTNGTARARLLLKMGEVCELRLGESNKAITHYRQAVQSDAENRIAIAALRRMLTKSEKFDEVAKLLESEANLVSEPRAAARVWLSLGDVHENRLGNADRALAAYKQAMKLDPALRPAVDGTIRLLEASGDHRQLADQLIVEQEEALEPMYAVAAAFHAGQVQRDQLRQSKEAAATFEKMVERDPEHVGALLALERIYQYGGDHDALALVYQRQAAAFNDAAARVAAYRGLLGVLEQAEKVDLDRVRQTQMALLQVAPNDVQALLALEALALSAEDMALMAQLDAKLSVAGLDRHSTSAYQTRLAEAMEARGDRAALEVFRAALSHDPLNMAAARGISRIAEATTAPDLLAEAAEHEAKVLGRIDEGARLLVTAAGKLASAGDYSGAAQRLSRALHLDPDHARAADSLVALTGHGVAPEYVTDALSRAAYDATSRERRASLWVAVARLESRSKRDIGAATVAVQRALAERPNDVDAHLLLAHFHAGSKKWEECVLQLQALLKLNPAEDVRFDALLRLATIQHERLKQTALAANNVSAALAMQPENREALELMLRVQLDREELAAAAETAEKLVQTARSDPERARALYHSARLHRQKGDLKRASEAFAEALSLTGTDDAVAQEYRDWLEARRAKADWKPYAEALRLYLHRSGLSDQQIMFARRALGLVLYDKLNETDEGLAELQRALHLAPQDMELQRAYAERLERAGEYARAATQYHRLLQRSPHALNYWRSLAGCYKGLLSDDQARAALAPLLASGDATDDERAKYEAKRPNPGGARRNAFSDGALRAAEQDLSVTGPAVELLQALAPAYPKLYPIPFDTYRVSAKDKLVGRSSHKFRALAEDVAGVFGVVDFDLYVHSGGVNGVSVECGDHPSIFIHKDLENRKKTEQVFALARIFANIARGTYVLDKLPVTELELLLVCAARNYQAGFGSELGDPGTLDAQARRINKALPWFKGNRVEPSARAFAQAGLNVQAWAKEAHIAAVRAACIVCDDTAVGLRAIAVAGADDSFVERVAGFLASDAGQKLYKRVYG